MPLKEELSVWSCLLGAVCLELSVWSCLFGAVCLDLSVCLFGVPQKIENEAGHKKLKMSGSDQASVSRRLVRAQRVMDSTLRTGTS